MGVDFDYFQTRPVRPPSTLNVYILVHTIVIPLGVPHSVLPPNSHYSFAHPPPLHWVAYNVALICLVVAVDVHCSVQRISQHDLQLGRSKVEEVERTEGRLLLLIAQRRRRLSKRHNGGQLTTEHGRSYCGNY